MKSDYAKVANFFISKSLDERKWIDALRLQYLMYISNGLYSSLNGCLLIDDELTITRTGFRFEKTYNETKRFGTNHLTTFIGGKQMLSDGEIKDFLNDCWTLLSGKDSITLCMICRTEPDPYKILYTPNNIGMEIPDSFILEQFKSSIKQ